MGKIEHVGSLSALQPYLDKSKDGLVVIDFHATWCGPCHAIAPFYEQMSAKYSKATFLKGVRAMPTFVFIQGGKVVESVRGANRNGIETALKKYTGGATGSTDGHSWGSGNKLGDGAASAGPIHPQQLVEGAKGLNPQLLILLAGLAIWLYLAFRS